MEVRPGSGGVAAAPHPQFVFAAALATRLPSSRIGAQVALL